jgi:hypothetical protein
VRRQVSSQGEILQKLEKPRALTAFSAYNFYFLQMHQGFMSGLAPRTGAGVNERTKKAPFQMQKVEQQYRLHY